MLAVIQRPAHATGNARLPRLPGSLSAGAVPVNDGLDAIRAAANSSANRNGVDLIDTSGFIDPALITVANKVNELITVLRR
jgi:hypothetical protein